MFVVGMNDVLPKPFTKDGLLSILEVPSSFFSIGVGVGLLIGRGVYRNI